MISLIYRLAEFVENRKRLFRGASHSMMTNRNEDFEAVSEGRMIKNLGGFIRCLPHVDFQGLFAGDVMVRREPQGVRFRESLTLLHH